MREISAERVLLLAGVALAALAGGFAGAFWKLLNDFELLTFWQIISLTAPMTIAVAVIAGFAFSGEHLSLAGVAVVILVAAGISAVIGLHSARPVADAFSLKSCRADLYHVGTYPACVENATPHSILEAAVRLVGAYWKVYGWRLFASALVAGTAVGYLMAVTLPRYLARGAGTGLAA